MTLAIVILLALAFGALFYLYAWRPIRTYIALRGERIITCPENRQSAAVHVAAGRAALSAAGTHPELRLKDCTRWPEMAGCGQECLAQIEAAPDSCRVVTLVGEWYKDRECVTCGAPIDHLHWYDRRAGLMDPEGHVRQWQDVKSEELPRVFTTHRPLCWDCAIAATLRQEHPELVTDR